MNKERILILSCCAPDALGSYETFAEEFIPVFFFFNPNIHPEEEYQKRLEEMLKLGKILRVEAIAGEYNPEKWFYNVRAFTQEKEGGTRCNICFAVRLSETARKAKALGIKKFSTTLTISPKKNVSAINRIGKMIGKKEGVEFVEKLLRKKGGFEKSIVLSKKFNLYRQNYCGCLFSLRSRNFN
ncbi:MAG: epoxyqueuosine reductase QueH [Candidatus Aminicenantia bacterium]